MLKNNKTLAVLLTVPFFLTACGTFFDKDNTPAPTPLTVYKPEVVPTVLWSAKVGKGATGKDYLKMSPVVSGSSIYTTSTNGTITSLNNMTGRKNWQVDFGAKLSSGPGAGEGVVVVGSRDGLIVALNESNGCQRWRASIPGEIIASPAVGNGLVIVKATDGSTRAYSIDNGSLVWSYHQQEPNLILRGSSAPIIHRQDVIIGYASGNLAKLGVNDGQLLWQEPVADAQGAFAIQRMIDIDADPIVFDYRIYVVTYQGRISALDFGSGRTVWTHDISSYTGMTADNSNVYLTDATGYVWAYNTENGNINWRQHMLKYRIISAPALLGNYVVMGDAEGYLHWLNKSDGHLAGRASLGSAIYANPVVENNVLYALSNSGYLAAYTLR